MRGRCEGRARERRAYAHVCTLHVYARVYTCTHVYANLPKDIDDGLRFERPVWLLALAARADAIEELVDVLDGERLHPIEHNKLIGYVWERRTHKKEPQQAGDTRMR